jgi:hypothetical protein
MTVHQGHWRRRAERWLPGQHLESDASESVLIARPVNLATEALLRRHIGRRPDRHACHGESFGLGDLRDPKIGHDRPSLFIDHDVPRLHISVNDPLSVGVTEGATDLAEEGLHHGNREWTQLLDDGIERGPLDQLHHEEEHPLHFANRIDRDDIGVAQGSGGARLALEALHHALAIDQPRSHDLDRHFAVERQIMRQIDGRHAALAELPRDVIFPEGDPPKMLQKVIAARDGGRAGRRGGPACVW